MKARHAQDLLLGQRVSEEAEQRLSNVREQAEAFRKSLLAGLFGPHSLEDRIRWGDGGAPEVDDASV